ncbi:hypothetical protein BDQ12DRAFT_150777 [Crucibulum laeve]|uniref:Uncharacterized protein n=1 Tax=Crucibulum laeve TaxID=68775 RepID=A0A5C3LZ03_9AGAR|nr:hypothetical protein BDQ12DRAFT_150777 [Crucibulum laeve]
MSARKLNMKLKSAYSRITLNRLTAAFFLFSFIHCFSQGIIQSLLFTVDAEYNALVYTIVKPVHTGIPAANITFLDGPPGRLQLDRLRLMMCNDIPHGQVTYPCIEVFNSKAVLSSQNTTVLKNWQNGIDVASNREDPFNIARITGVTLTTHGSPPITLSLQCTQTLVHPEQIFQNFRREDVTLILIQFWLLAISTLAIVNDSVPHTLAVLITRGLITGWSIYAVWRTQYYKDIFQEIISKPGTPCSLELFSPYFQTRTAYEIADLVLSCTALVTACCLSWTLLRSFKCVGAPEKINRINKFFMALLACLQLEAFVLVAAMGLWIDVLIKTAIAKISAHSTIYLGLFIITTILLLPWITMGWYAIQREMKKTMAAFLLVAFLITLGWLIMFYSIVYRWTFVQWPFLGCFTVASLILLVASIALGVICRLNFGKGLAEYLRAEAALASSNFAPEIFSHDEEKQISPLKEKQTDFEESVATFYIPELHSNATIEERKDLAFVRPPRNDSPQYNVPFNKPF